MEEQPATEPPRRGLYGQRPSKSGDASRLAQLARIAAMSPRERMLLALRLGYRDRYLAERRAAQP
jgi:hypothetical protein